MRVAFYAPMKPPDHPVPSGDRRMARAFLDLLVRLGHEPTVACRLRSWDGGGDRRRQARLAALGATFAERLARRRPAPELWLTYHLYHKAPDHLGPRVSRALGIPYVVAEASLAGKQAAGPWAQGHRASVEALATAARVLALTSVDHDGLAPLIAPDRLVRFPPFIDARPYRDAIAAKAELAIAHGLDAGLPWLLTVAMMRAGAKLRSYRVLAEALARLTDRPWQLVVVGDGPARAEVEAALRPLGGRVRLLGALAAQQLPELYATADLYVWPACDEAYGLALLEAQAAGRAVVAGREYGVPDIVADNVTGLLVPPRDAHGLAAAIGALLGDPGRRCRMGHAARARVMAEHDVATAARRLGAILEEARACACA